MLFSFFPFLITRKEHLNVSCTQPLNEVSRRPPNRSPKQQPHQILIKWNVSELIGVGCLLAKRGCGVCGATRRVRERTIRHRPFVVRRNQEPLTKRVSCCFSFVFLDFKYGHRKQSIVIDGTRDIPLPLRILYTAVLCYLLPSPTSASSP